MEEDFSAPLANIYGAPLSRKRKVMKGRKVHGGFSISPHSKESEEKSMGEQNKGFLAPNSLSFSSFLARAHFFRRAKGKRGVSLFHYVTKTVKEEEEEEER